MNVHMLIAMHLMTRDESCGTPERLSARAQHCIRACASLGLMKRAGEGRSGSLSLDAHWHECEQHGELLSGAAYSQQRSRQKAGFAAIVLLSRICRRTQKRHEMAEIER